MTRSFLLVCWLSHLSLGMVAAQQGTSASVPAPRSVLGFDVGDDFRLADYQQSLRYFRTLDENSDRLQLVEPVT